jgi:pyruvate/2-oxoglutarate dehydrogenase complex dihydrolipoamide dehydrogenase (E3) component
MTERFEAIVIGAGPAGEVAASRLNTLGLRTVTGPRSWVHLL